MSRRIRLALLGLLLAPVATPGASAQPAADPAVARGVAYLGRAGEGGMAGEAAIAALAMIKAGVPGSDPGLARHLEKVRARFSGSSYNPQRSGGSEIYEAAVIAMALVGLESTEYRPQIDSVAGFLIGRQNGNGSWDYTGRTQGDTSISQYAVLGLWEAENAGARIPPQVWERAARWFLSVQSSQGSWNYHRDEGSRYPETISMTSAGVGSLLICKRQLAPYRGGGEERESQLLSPLLAGEGGRPSYKIETSDRVLNQAIGRGVSWIARNFGLGANSAIGQSAYYGLYGIERIGALTQQDRLGGLEWFGTGRQHILGSQRADGSWSAQHGDLPNTAWALLFLTRATEKSVRRFEVQRLGGGTLLGGRGLPEDLSELAVAQGRVIVRPMNGAIDEMLAVLEDPRAEGADSALAGLVDRYHRQGPSALRPYVDRFRKLLEDPDPGLRETAAWALARTGDLDVAPALIAALEDPDGRVVATARIGLQLLGRQIEGFGPPDGATAEQKAEAARLWLDWYRSVRPPDLGGEGESFGTGPDTR